MSYSIVLFIYLLLAFYFNELLLLPFFLIYAFTNKIKFRVHSINIGYILLVIALFVIGILNYSEGFNFNLFFHFLLLLLLTLFVKDEHFRISGFIPVIKLFLVFNVFFFLIGVYTAESNHFFFIQNGFFRYQGIFQEPSLAGFNFILIASILYYNKGKLIWLILSLFFIIATFSGSAYFVLFVMIFLEFKRFFLNKKFLKIAVVLILLAIPIVLYLFNREDVQYLVIDRLERLIEGRDNSAKIRFLGPLQVITYTFKNSPLWGFGLGSIEHVISNNRDFFSYFYHYTGKATEKVNNGYAVIIGFGGLFYLVAHLFLLYFIYRFQLAKRFKTLFYFVLIYPFFAGQFVHIFYWFLIYLISNLREEFLKPKAIHSSD